MGGLSSSVLHLAICLSKIYKENKHLILVQEDPNYENFEIDYILPDNLSVERLSKVGPKIYPFSFEMKNKINSFNPDIIYLKGLWKQTSIEAYLWKKKNKKKILIVSPAGMLQPVPFSHNKFKKKLSLFFIENKLLKICDLVQSVSELEQSCFLKSNYKFKRQIYIPEGIPIVYKGLKLKKNNFSKKLIFLSRISPIKGLEIFIEALALVNFKGWQFIIYGFGDEKYIKKIELLIRKYNLEKNIKWASSVFGKEKCIAYEEASGFVLPSLSEAFGISIAEAMSFGLPVITTTATPWLDIQKEKTGWYVKPNKIELAKAVQSLFDSKEEELIIMGERAQKLIAKRYDWNKTAKQMEEQIEIIKKFKKEFEK